MIYQQATEINLTHHLKL